MLPISSAASPPRRRAAAAPNGSESCAVLPAIAALSSCAVGGDLSPGRRRSARPRAGRRSTIGACSPPCSSSVTSSALVDSASPGRNDVDSFFSASANLPGRFGADRARRRRRSQSAGDDPLGAVRPAGRVRRRDIGRADPTGSEPCRLSRAARELVRLGDRPPAGEALAHVGGGAAVDRLAALEQRRRRPPARRPARRAGGTARARPARAARGRRRRAPPRATAARRKSSACSRWPKPPACSRRDHVQQPQVAERGVLVALLAGQRARAAAARRRPPRSRPGSACPRGPCGARRAPRGRSAVEKKPPRSGSAKRSRIVSASARASANQRGSKVAS